MPIIKGPSPFRYRRVILNELLEYARNEFTNSVFGLLLMIAIYKCSRDIISIKSLLKVLDCDGPTYAVNNTIYLRAVPIAYERTVFPEPATCDP